MIMPGLCPGSWFSSIWTAKLGKIPAHKPPQLPKNRSEARKSRDFPHPVKSRHPEIPWAKVAGIGNVLRHNYESIAAPVMWTLVRDDLQPLEKVCRDELAAAIAREAP